jgi:hypothetical protein
MSRGGGYNDHFAAIVQKAQTTAYFIGRVTSRTSLPSPRTVCRIVKAVLIPQITYGFAFLPLPVGFANKITQIIAAPLRRALGLPKNSSAARVLWEYGLYDVHTLHLKALLEALMRSQRCLDNEVVLAGELAVDFRAAAAAVVPIKSAKFCRPLAHSIVDQLAAVGLQEPPADKAALKTLLDSVAVAKFTTKAKPGQVAVKPTMAPLAYLQQDPKPDVCTRARVRLGVALSFDRLLLYKKRDSDACDLCHTGERGTLEHLLLACPVLHVPRSTCANALSELDVPLSMAVIQGLLPDDLTKKQHKDVLAISADFLKAVSRRHFL